MFEMTLFIKLYVIVARMNRKQDCQTNKEKEKYKLREREGDSEIERTRKVRYPNRKSKP